MSNAQPDPGILESAYRTVTPGYKSHGDTGMDLIGWIIFLGILTLLFPLIPIFLLVIGVGKLLSRLRKQ